MCVFLRHWVLDGGCEGIESALPGIGRPLTMKLVERECCMEGMCILVPFTLINNTFLL